MSVRFDNIFLVDMSGVKCFLVSEKRTWLVGIVEDCLVVVSCVVISALVEKYWNGLLMEWGTNGRLLSVLT